MKKRVSIASSVALILWMGATAPAQLFTRATGQQPPAPKPVFPELCPAKNAIVTADIALDAQGDVPAAQESSRGSHDRLQAALDACAGSGRSVRVVRGGATRELNALVTSPFTIPTGVTLLLDPGVTVFATLDASQFQVPGAKTHCGIIEKVSARNSCVPFITFADGAQNAGIMGYGTIDMRGNKPLLQPAGVVQDPAFDYACSEKFANRCCNTKHVSWWDLSCQSTQNNSSGRPFSYQQNPFTIFVQQTKSGMRAKHITLFGITVKDGVFWNIYTEGVDDFVVWDIKLIGPGSKNEIYNTDGIDPGGVDGATLAYNWISTGDDDIAITSRNSESRNISVLHNHIFDGHGASIGSATNKGVRNVLFADNLLYGDANFDHSDARAINIKTDRDRAGEITQITYTNMCIANMQHAIVMSPSYAGKQSGSDPNIHNVLLSKVMFGTAKGVPAFLTPPGRPMVATGSVEFDGNPGFPLVVKLEDVNTDAMVLRARSDPGHSNYANPKDAKIDATAGYVSANLYNLLKTNGAQMQGERGNSKGWATACTYDFLATDVALAGGESNASNWTHAVAHAGQPVRLNVQLQPAIADSTAEDKSPAVHVPLATGTIDVLYHDAGTKLASAPVTKIGTWTELMLPLPTAAGSYAFDVRYSGDGNYAGKMAGSIVVDVKPR
jgi:polygalacturonase